MKKRLLVLGFILFPALVFAQFEQKVSINLSAGGFKTFGKKYTEYTGPLQMPNYKLGLTVNGEFQFRIGEHLSVAAGFGIMTTNRWNYSTPDKDNWLYWTIEDTTTWQLLAEGEDYLDLRNYSVFASPKYYLLPGKKWDPYFFAGVNLNWTRAWFENNLWAAMDKLGRLAPDDPGPWNDNLEESFGIGFNPGFGVEYSSGGRFHFYIETSYYFIALDKNNFKDPSRVENFNAVVFQAGCRLNFIKTKEL